MDEIWKPISGFETYYEISNQGRVRGLPRLVKCRSNKNRLLPLKILVNSKHNQGYLVVFLSKDSIRYPRTIHTLVAEHFIPNQDSKAEVNHKDLNKENNSVTNLEWTTKQGNIEHARINGAYKSRNFKRIVQLELSGKFIKEWSSLTEVRKALGFKLSALSQCLNGRSKSCAGFKWEFKCYQNT